MNKPLLSHATETAVEHYLMNPAHGLCLLGPIGAGKGELAQYIAETILGTKASEAVLHVDVSSAAIDGVRKMQSFLHLKVPGKNSIRRVVILERAELLSIEAQNALLKTLEEPPADTIIILTASSAAELKPTIKSRVQLITVKPLSQKEAEKAFPGSKDLQKLYALSGGYAGLLQALANDPDHELVQAVDQAKQLLQAPAYERLKMVDVLVKQKTDLALLLYALQRVLGAVIAKAKPAQMPKLIQASRALYETEQDLKHSANRKLLLTDLFLSL